MMDAISANLLSYSAQILCIVGLGALVAALFRIDAAPVRYTYWRLLGLLCLALPMLQPRITPMARMNANEAGNTLDTAAVVADTGVPAAAGPVLSGSELLLWILAIGAALRFAWLCAGLLKLRRLRHAGQTAARGEEHEELQRVIGARAEIRYVDRAKLPMTFGLIKPIVLLPSRLRDHPEHVRRAVVAHELVHVHRRDWACVIVEEVVRAVFWFHPAMWWLISTVQLAREEVVDELTVLVTGQRRTYVEALLAFADETPLAPAPAFARRRHLFRRMMLLSKEAFMSPRQIVASCAAMSLIVASGGSYAVRAFPLVGAAPEMNFSPRPQETTSTERLHSGPGPLERKAVPITPENPVPRRVNVTRAEYPAEAAAQAATARVRLQITLDELGRIAEVRVAGYDLRFASEQRVDDPQARRRVLDAFVESAATAVRQWRYEPPYQAPISFPVTISFSLGATEGSAGIPPPPPPAPPAPQTGPSTAWTGARAIRVGRGVKPPTKIKDVRPVYPPVAREAGIQGSVILEVVIGTDGRVSDARVLRSIPLLDQAALDAVAQWEFTPTVVTGEPTAVVMTTTVNFTLQ